MPLASYVAPLYAVSRLRAAGGALHACKRAFTPITCLFRRVSGPEFGPFKEYHVVEGEEAIFIYEFLFILYYTDIYFSIRR